MRAALLLVTLVLPLAAAAQSAPLRIGKITIDTLDVYSEAEASRGWVYRLADRLHIETRDSVIRKLLLFREGEPYSPERLAETERNLRALPFLKAAKVTPSEPRDGLVDVLVVTQDAWTIAPETQAGSSGGETTYGATISESNLLGLGKEISVRWAKTVDRRRVGIDYQDPAINADYWNAHLTWGFNSDGHERRASIRRPFYSFAAPWSAIAHFRNIRQDTRLFKDGRESARFRQDQREILLSYGRALEPNDYKANRVTGGLHLLRDNFSNPAAGTTIVPDDRDFRIAFARFEHAHNDFITLNFVNKDLRFEDFNLGQQYSVTAGISPVAFGAERNSGHFRAAWSDGKRVGPSMFLIPALSGEARSDRGWRHMIGRASVYGVLRNDTHHPSATVGRVVFTSGWRLDRDVQFVADSDTGLRAYRLREFEGSRTIIANLEHRIYLGREILQLASPGLVFFLDVGNATDGGIRSLFDLKTDIGVGIRVGLPRTPKNLLRIDLAYPLQPGNFGRRGLQVSFSSGQAF